MSSKDPPAIHHTPTLSLHAAQLATAAASRKARSIGVPMNIAVVDNTLHLLSFVRLQGAKLTSIDIAINKAFTAAGHKLGTHNYKEAVWPGGAAYGINISNGGRFTVIGGGVPVILEDGSCVGAVGCSTGTPDQDRQCSQAGVDAIVAYMKGQGIKAKL